MRQEVHNPDRYQRFRRRLRRAAGFVMPGTPLQDAFTNSEYCNHWERTVHLDYHPGQAEHERTKRRKEQASERQAEMRAEREAREFRR